jgi:hypothetical protein
MATSSRPLSQILHPTVLYLCEYQVRTTINYKNNASAPNLAKHLT